MSLSKRAEFHMDLRHDYVLVLEESMGEKEVKALQSDLEKLNFNVATDFEEETKEWRILIGLNDEMRILKEAEAQMIMVPRTYADKAKMQKVEKKRQQ